ncbi:integrase, catalytic region, zinc finger, CCHC-type containing protein [Tanacetum coccineum]
MESGGSFHMTPRRDFLYDFKEFNGGTVLLGDNSACAIIGIGKVRVQIKDGSSFVLKNVRYIPELKRNLISLGTLDREGYAMKLKNGRVKMIKGSLMVLSRTMKVNCVYSLDGWAESGEASVGLQEKESLAQGGFWSRSAHNRGSYRLCPCGSHSVEILKPELKVYSRKPKNTKNVGSSKLAKIVESKNANRSEPNHTWGSNAIDIPSSSSLVMTVRFGNDHIARIIGYRDYQLGNITISRVYYVEGLGHNLFSVGQFCDVDLEVAFRKNTCFIRNSEGVNLLSGSRDTNLYTISLDDMLTTSLIYLLSKASKTKSWLWYRRLSHLNFGTLNKLAKHSLARGIPRLKFHKDHLFLRTKDEAHEAIIICIKNIQVRLNATVRNVRTDNGSEFVNQTLREFYENVDISHQTFVARTPQQNGVVESRNRTLIEAARKLDAKADIGIFVGYTPAKKAFRIYNKRTQKTIETIHVTFDELTAMASEQFSSGTVLHSMTPSTSSSRLVSNPIPQQPCIPPPRDDWGRLFQPMFDEYFTPLSIAVSLVQEAAALRAMILADSPVSTSIDRMLHQHKNKNIL